MNCLLKRNAMLSLRFVLAALMGCLVLVCFAQPAAPIVSIEVVTEEDGDYVRLTWEAVEGAGSYNIYASSEVEPEHWGEPFATVEAEVTAYTTTETVDELGRTYFFYVTAYAEEEVVIPDWLVLVDGDLFNGNVTIDPFYISKYQVTQADFVDVMGDRNFHFPDNPTHPAELVVSWFDVIEYCNRLSISEGLTPAYSYLDSGVNPDDWYGRHPGWNEVAANHTNISCNWEADGYRLPTEAEWHHAANGAVYDPESEWLFGSPFQYSGSDDIDEVAWYNGNSDIGDGRQTHPVGTKAPNGLGIYDMSGNVFEWSWDIWGGTWPPVGDNPHGPDSGNFRVVRGGSWSNGVGNCTVSFRMALTAPSRRNNVGFRVSRRIP